ncbi:MAG TPA: hypothetical protein VF265_03145 [Nevskiaceae bacterium]
MSHSPDPRHAVSSDDEVAVRSRGRNRGPLLVIVLVTALPLLLAMAVFFVPTLRDGLQHNNRGQLVTPARDVPPLALHDLTGEELPVGAFSGHWSVIYIGGATCDEGCVRQVFQVHNIRWLLQEQYRRLRVFYLAPDSSSLRNAAGAMRTDADLYRKAGALPVMLTAAPDADHAADAMRFFGQAPGTVVLINPARHWILSYPPGFKVEDVYHDLRRLLRFSQLG